MRKILAGICVSLLSVLVTLAIVEIGFRVFANSKKETWSDRPHEYFIHEASPTFQDYPHTEKKPDNVFRIAVIGDSFTFGPYLQFDDAFPKRMERYLNLNTDQKKVEVINYGVPAYSTSHEVPVVKKAIEEGADFILMEITLNDPEIKPYTPTELYRDKNKFGELELHGKIFQHWHSLSFALSRLHNNVTYDNYVKKFFNLFDKPKTWANFKNSWESIQHLTNDAHVPTAAVVFPLFGIPLTSEYPFHPIHQKISTLMDALHIPLLDLFATFQGIPLERLQVIVGQDFHPNEIGHRLAAESILAWLKQTALLPSNLFPKLSSPERTGIKVPGKEAPKSNLDTSDEAEHVTDEGEEVGE